jgi:hypothetical protein
MVMREERASISAETRPVKPIDRTLLGRPRYWWKATLCKTSKNGRPWLARRSSRRLVQSQSPGASGAR